MKTLTKAQLEVYEFIAQYIKTSGHSPSTRDICSRFRLASTSTAAHYVQKLEEAGYISRTPGRARTIILIETNQPSRQTMKAETVMAALNAARQADVGLLWLARLLADAQLDKVRDSAGWLEYLTRMVESMEGSK